MFRRLERIIAGMERVAIICSAILVLLITLFICYDVVMRYVFNNPTVWVTEISTYMLLFITFMGAAYTLRIDSHVSCDIIVLLVKPKIRRFFFLIGAPFGLAYCLVLGWQAWRTFFMSYKTNEVSLYTLATPLMYPYFVMPVGMFLLVLAYFVKIRLIFLKSPQESSENSKDE